MWKLRGYLLKGPLGVVNIQYLSGPAILNSILFLPFFMSPITFYFHWAFNNVFHIQFNKTWPWFQYNYHTINCSFLFDQPNLVSLIRSYLYHVSLSQIYSTKPRLQQLLLLCFNSQCLTLPHEPLQGSLPSHQTPRGTSAANLGDYRHCCCNLLNYKWFFLVISFNCVKLPNCNGSCMQKYC